jgi:hypothetical protein
MEQTTAVAGEQVTGLLFSSQGAGWSNRRPENL